jgi:hypothetical protein
VSPSRAPSWPSATSENRVYYGKSVTPMDILVRGDAGNREAVRLLTTLAKVAES